MDEAIRQAARCLFQPQLKRGFKPTAIYPYTDADGNPVYWKARLDKPPEKCIRPFHFNGSKYVIGEPKLNGKGKLLYGLPEILSNQEQIVIVVEGESCVHANRRLGLCATTSGGSTSAKKADWSPLKGRDVIIWPDNDEAGLKYAHEVAECLQPIATSVKIIDVTQLGLHDKEDAVDWVAKHPNANAEDVLALPIIEEETWPEPQRLPPPGGIEAPPVYPIDQLPECLQESAKEVARFVKVDKAAPATIGISIAATAIGKKAEIEERLGLVHYPALFFITPAGSGERKSPTFRYMTRPLTKWTESQLEAYDQACIDVKASNIAIDAAINGLKKDAQKDPKKVDEVQRDIAEQERKRQTVPPFPRLFDTDATEQYLVRQMHDRGGAFAVMSGEGRAVIDHIQGKYSGGEGRTGDSVYLAGITGDTITRGRIGGEGGSEDRVIHNPCLNVCVMVQPDKYLSLARTKTLRESGLIPRIWPVWLPSMVGKQHEQKDEPGLQQDKLDDFEKAVTDILNHEPATANGEAIPHRVTLCADAAEHRRLFHNKIQDYMADGGDLEDARAITAKAVTQTCKLALVLHVLNNPTVLKQETSELPLETWAAAQTIGTYHLTEAVRIQRLSDEDQSLAMARQILPWLKRQTRAEITPRMVMQYGPRPRPKTIHECNETLGVLVDHKILVQKVNSTPPTYLVNPRIRSHCSQCSQGKGVEMKHENESEALATVATQANEK